MPHVIVEYSANLRADVGALVDALHDATLDTGVADVDALRTRAAVREHFAIGDRHAENTFVAVVARLGAGRSDDDRSRLIAALMAALERSLGDAVGTAMLSVEIQEIDPDRRLNHNHVRSRIAARRGPA